MNFYNTTNTENSLVHETWTLCDADLASMPLAVVTRRFNLALEELVGEIINADGTWQWDDTNQTDLPIGTQTLVASQAVYSFNDKFLQIERVKIKDVSGNWHILHPVDEIDLGGTAIEEYFTDTGLPTYYDKVGDDTIKLYPAPTATDCTLINGLKIHFKRTAHLFAVDDETATPGLPSTHHKILCYMAAIPYCMSYKPQRVALYEKKVDEMKKTLLKFYAHREGDVRNIITNKSICSV